eukprot:TRINITY_DN19771_c0_g1_i1.p1 TRINITY_DN19771_c0_g1~~TRINITY_DN19771_c0_g1_i1.p1  ORF type:complete len:425 (-),score=86.31 TRINITY_DN19771_c0_g1_i1:49-1323(-)
MMRRPPRSTLSSSSAASDVYKRQVSGSAAQRGFAHGYLLGQQILDFFRFFTLQATVNSTELYTSKIVPFIDPQGGWYRYDQEYLTEIDAIILGMQSSPSLVHGMHVEELSRDFQRADLLYLNDYGAFPEAPMANPIECSQFAFWGNSTASRLIAGRNMDGENDFRKTTVSHFLVHAVSDEHGNRFVHFMWPGFVIAASGVNQHGVYVMMNDGESNPNGPLARGLSPFGWVVRQMLLNSSSISDIRLVADRYKTDQGGTCSAGCNLMIAESSDAASAVVLESDRAHNTWREAGQVQPLISTGIMVTNHELRAPAYDAARPLDNWGREVYFSSLWRYEAGKNMVNAWTEYEQSVGLQEMIRLLQTVTHATTEHSIIFQVDQAGGLALHVAVADMSVGGWHAPYLRWMTVQFSQFFSNSLGTERSTM